MEIWVASKALTQGVIGKTATTTSVEGMVQAGPYEYYHGEGRGWFRTRKEAVVAAEVMRLKKIKSLEKQLKKLKALKFDE
ncbi:MAG: hypothetical protein E6R03_05220 [Hyphomicrobiaceae bacterium]|nr:MAG: hypothetical protein E6R03_05220 [Hyphomicrobiaceae bacterium]